MMQSSTHVRGVLAPPHHQPVAASHYLCAWVVYVVYTSAVLMLLIHLLRHVCYSCRILVYASSRGSVTIATMGVAVTNLANRYYNRRMVLFVYE